MFYVQLCIVFMGKNNIVDGSLVRDIKKQGWNISVGSFYSNGIFVIQWIVNDQIIDVLCEKVMYCCFIGFDVVLFYY